MLEVVKDSGRITEGPDDLMIVTQSEMATWMTDRRKWYLSYYRRLRRVHDHAKAPTVGTLFHAGLEAYYREHAHPLTVVQARAEALITPGLPENLAEMLLEAAELAGIMLEGYLEWVDETAADADFDITGAEQKVEARLGSTPFVLRGKMDARVTVRSTGFRAQLEHKTVQSLGTLPQYAQSNFQFLTYDLLAYLEALASGDPDLRTDGVILNMARKVKRTAKAKPPFYGRHEVRHNLNELRSHYKHVVAIATAIHDARARLDAGEDHHVVCPPTANRDSTWANPFLFVYPLMDDGSDYESMLADPNLFEQYDPLERYEEEEDGDA